MTGHDAATQYIEKLAWFTGLKTIGTAIASNIKNTPQILGKTIGGIGKGMEEGVGILGAAKGALKSNVLKDLTPEQFKTLGRAGYGAGVAGSGLVGLGVGNSLAHSMKQQQQPDVQVVYANPQSGY